MLHSINKHYHYSSTALSLLKELAEFLERKQKKGEKYSENTRDICNSCVCTFHGWGLRINLKVQLPLPDIQRNDITLTSPRDWDRLQQTVLELCQGCLKNIGNGNDYNGVTLTRCANDLAQFNITKQGRINTIIRYLEERFQCLQGNKFIRH